MRVYTLDDLNTTEGQDGLINLCDKYYPTLASSWAAYGKGLADVADAAALREAKACSIVFKRLSRSASSRKNPSLHLQADRKRGKTLIIPRRVNTQPADVIEHFIAGRDKAYRLIPRKAFNYSSAKYLMVRTIWLV